MVMSKVLVSLVLFISLCITSSIEAHPIHVPNRSPVALRRLVAVQGYVSCKPCIDVGQDTLMHSVPLPGATVKMICHGKTQDNPLILSAVTDKGGFFFIPPTKKVSEFGAKKRCRVYLHSPPTHSKCQHSTHMNGGLSGAYLRSIKPSKSSKPLPFALYTVGPFAYEPLPSACYKV
ncbi:hypothetical protein C5167_009053 [Papaver somniferum]|uniref:Pollen Ole e 1 allergen and extensin family protein n=1 Tax=Papaver somniferum TaxID=3469 RepID=A0A4Y7JWA5_PAPSO|nr:non-classical arabinogalactan protein 31-like [Papaver somniferum]RZC65363.1 hypothetical protein C5167_009053 [Papaver somniferum]